MTGLPGGARRRPVLVEAWRRRKSAAFDLERNSTAGRTVEIDFWGDRRRVYANANLSIYSGQTCNARCPFCVEELRPASRGVELAAQKTVEPDDERYFAALEDALRTVAPLAPSTSVTGGEPSRDPRLVRILATLAAHGTRKRTVTTNASGLLDPVPDGVAGVASGRPVVDALAATGVRHLNVSRAHPDTARNARLMRYEEGLDAHGLAEVVRRASAGGVRTRLSCVLLRGAVEDFDGVLGYLAFARSVGVRAVIFRGLMRVDPATVIENYVTRYTEARRAPLDPVLARVSRDPRFELVRQILGYYYYVEVWRFGALSVVFEEADLARLEATKRVDPGTVHELVFHPNGRLATTWQPWEGALG